MAKKDVHGLERDVLEKVAKLYGFRVVSCGEVEGGYRNLTHSFLTSDGQRLNFILYKREPGIVELIKRTNALGKYVAAKGLPVRAPVDDRILKVGQRYGSLYEYLGGATIPWEDYSMKHIKLLGYALARFHAVSEGFSGDLPNVEGVYEAIYDRMAAYFGGQQVKKAIYEKLGLRVILPDFKPLLFEARQLTPRTALHMDMVRSNLLFQKDPNLKRPGLLQGETLQVGDLALSGILDLEKAARGHVVFDAARTLAFLLVDCAKPEEKIRKYFLYSGYRKRGGKDVYAEIPSYIVRSDSLSTKGQLVLPRSAGEAESSRTMQDEISGAIVLEQLITMFLVYDFYKFLKQNPYESLGENHHFKRTVDILIARKVVQYVD